MGIGFEKDAFFEKRSGFCGDRGKIKVVAVALMEMRGGRGVAKKAFF